MLYVGREKEEAKQMDEWGGRDNLGDRESERESGCIGVELPPLCYKDTDV